MRFRSGALSGALCGMVTVLVACAEMGLSSVAKAQAPEQTGRGVFTDTFETDVGAWVAYGPHANVRVTGDSAHVKNGKGALAFTFVVSDAKEDKAAALPFDLLLRPTPDGRLAKMKAITFWARCDIAGGYAVSLQEKEGGRYTTLIWLPKDQWQSVILTPEDFWLSDDKTDPKDPDGKLDLDTVDNIGILSVWSFLALSAGESAESVAYLSHALGSHTLWLDDFSAATEAPLFDLPPPALPAKTQGIWIDEMHRATLGWLALGNLEISLDKEAPFHTRGIRAQYAQEPGAYVALLHDMHRFNLTHQDRLTFEVASVKSAKLAITLEEKGGARYVAIIDVPGDSVATRKSISFADFMIGDDSPRDADGKLDLDQIKTFSIADITGAFGASKQRNTLWIGPISAVTQTP